MSTKQSPHFSQHEIEQSAEALRQRILSEQEVLKETIMSSITNFTKANNRDTFAVPAPAPQTSAVLQNADWNNVGAPTGFYTDVLTGVPAVAQIQISGTDVVAGKPGQYTLTLSLSGTSTCQLSAALADALGNASTVVGSFTYRSRCQQVTVSEDGLVTGVSRTNGGEIVIEYPAGQVTPVGPSMPASSDKIAATLIVTVLA